MDDFIGDWIYNDRTPTFEEVILTYRAVVSSPHEFDFSKNDVINIGVEKLNMGREEVLFGAAFGYR